MKRMICVILLFVVLCGQAGAEEPELSSELISAAPEVAGLMNSSAENMYGLIDGAVSILRDAMSDGKRYLLAGVRSVSAILAGVLLLGIAECLGGGITARHTNLIGALYITVVSAGDVKALIGLGQDTVTNVSLLSKTLIPALAGAAAAGGGITSASVRQVATVFFVDLLLTVIERLLIPLLHLYIASAAANAVLENGAMEGIASLIKKVIGWVLGALLAVFTAYLSISGAIAGAVDARTVRAAKTAVSTVVPVVGSVLAEVAETVLAGAGILRAMIGAFGTLAILSLCLLPFLRLGIQYLLYQGAVFVAQAAGPKRLSKILAMFADAFALVLAMTGTSALLMIISIVSTLTMVTP